MIYMTCEICKQPTYEWNLFKEQFWCNTCGKWISLKLDEVESNER